MQWITKPIMLVLLAAMISCSGDSSSITPKPIPGDNGHIENPLERWRSYGVDDYQFEQRQICFCIDGDKQVRITVRNNVIIKAVDIATGDIIPESRRKYYRTIDQLFEFIDDIPADAAQVDIDYNERYGYPELIYVDFKDYMVDEEMGYKTENVLLLQ